MTVAAVSRGGWSAAMRMCNISVLQICNPCVMHICLRGGAMHMDSLSRGSSRIGDHSMGGGRSTWDLDHTFEFCEYFGN